MLSNDGRGIRPTKLDTGPLTNSLLAEFSGLRFQRTHVTSRTTTTTRIPPQCKTREQTKNLIVANRIFEPKICLGLKNLFGPKFFWTHNFVVSNNLFDQNKFWMQNVFSDRNFFLTLGFS